MELGKKFGVQSLKFGVQSFTCKKLTFSNSHYQIKRKIHSPAIHGWGLWLMNCNQEGRLRPFTIKSSKKNSEGLIMQKGMNALHIYYQSLSLSQP